MALNLNGRSGLLCSYLPNGDPRRGWEFRAPGHGGLDWESIIRALNQIGYDGPLSVEWEDVGVDREVAAPEALAFVRSKSAQASARQFDAAFSTTQ